MTVREDIIAKLMVKSVTKIIKELTLGDFNQMESELVEKSQK